MTAKRKLQIYLGTENFTANSSMGKFGPARLPDELIENFHLMDKLQCFVKVNFPGAAPTTLNIDIEMEFNLAGTDAVEEADHWTTLIAGADIQNISAEGVFKGDMYSDVIPQRVRMVRSITAAAYGGGVDLEIWLNATLRH